MNEGKNRLFSPLEIDAVGEILNISLGSSATAVSNLLGRRVDITTPVVRILEYNEFEFSSLEPAIGVEITYVAGLSGSNVMLLKREDVKKILEILMSTEIPDAEFEMDEMAISAVCEVMNQMMGASATALSEFLGETVNISTPKSFEVISSDMFKTNYFDMMKPMIVVGFQLSIEDCMESEFITLMDADLGKQMIASFGLSIPVDEDEPATVSMPNSDGGAGSTGGMLSQEEIEKLMHSAQTMPAEAPAPAGAEGSGGMMSQEEIEKLMQGQTSAPAPVQPQAQEQPQMQAQPQAQVQPQMQVQPQVQVQPQMQPVQQPEAPKVINVQPLYENTSGKEVKLTKEENANLDMIMSVPLQISVEIGRTKRSVREIMDFSAGTLLVLDKMAGDTVDIYVNGQRIARGDVVVVDDSFGVRITEILRGADLQAKS